MDEHDLLLPSFRGNGWALMLVAGCRRHDQALQSRDQTGWPPLQGRRRTHGVHPGATCHHADTSLGCLDQHARVADAITLQLLSLVRVRMTTICSPFVSCIT